MRPRRPKAFPLIRTTIPCRSDHEPIYQQAKAVALETEGGTMKHLKRIAMGALLLLLAVIGLSIGCGAAMLVEHAIRQGGWVSVAITTPVALVVLWLIGSDMA